MPERTQSYATNRSLTVGMITCSRPIIDVHDSINRLRSGGFGDLVHLFCEPGTPTLRPMPRVIVHHNPVRRGMVGNWAYSLRWLVEHTQADFLMICEDDVAFCRGARDAWNSSIDQLGPVGFWSLYTPRRDRELVRQSRGWVASNRGRDTWGTQAMCFPRSSAEILLKYDALRVEDQMRGPTDAIVAQCFVDAKIPCYYHNPSLANHLGQISSVGNNWQDDHVGFEFDLEYQPDPQIRSTAVAELPQPAESHIQVRSSRAAVVTVFQENIPQEVISAQAEVICRILPRGCEFVPFAVGHHALGLDEYFSELGYDAYVIFDIDCIPLANWVIPWLLDNALAGLLVGIAQRANHLENDGHIYAGPSGVAFSRATFERLGRPSFRDTPRGDVGEELTYACERLGVPICLLWPTDVMENKWTLRPGIPFGLGTTFGNALFHAFEISKGHTVSMFLKKCSDVLQNPNGSTERTYFSDVSDYSRPLLSNETIAPKASTAASTPDFHEQWYADAELKLLEEAVRRTEPLHGAVVEFGGWEGRSTVIIANACFPDPLIVADTWKGYSTQGENHETVQIALKRDIFGGFNNNVRILTKGNVVTRRQDALSFLRECADPIKFCHIDAAHDYATVRDTLKLLLPLLTEGAILFGHDYESAHAGRDDLQGGVQRAVREILPHHTAKGNTWSYTHVLR